MIGISESRANNHLSDSQYFLRLGAALGIVGIIWLGSSLFKSEAPNEKNPTNASSLEKNNLYISSLNIAQEAFLVPTSDLATPIRKWNMKPPELSAQSIYAFDANSGKVLLAKEPDQIRQIASLSKLITALVILEKANLKDEMIVSQNAVNTFGEMGGLVTNESITIESLLYAMLIESSNDAAVALAEKFNGQFVGYMNQKAKELGLQNTRFSDPSGLNIENVSTAREMTKIMQETIKYPILNYVMKTPEIEIFSADGKQKHKLINSNKLLEKYPEIIAGKTGYLDEAGSCMVIALQAPSGDNVIINVILGSQDRINEMDKLIHWEKNGFVW